MNRRDLITSILALSAVPVAALAKRRIPHTVIELKPTRIAIEFYRIDTKDMWFVERSFQELLINMRFIVLNHYDPPELLLSSWQAVYHSPIYICDADGKLSGYNQDIGWRHSLEAVRGAA